MARRKNKNLTYILMGVGLVLIILVLFFIFNSPKLLKVKEFDVFVVVKERGIGLDVNNSFLTFGHVNPGGGARRFIIFNNSYDFPVKVETSMSENLIGLVNTNSTFIIPVGNNISLPVELSIPENFTLGNYTGKIRFEMYEFKW